MKKIVQYFESVLLWIVCCIPVITIAASTTAMHFVGLKLAQGEDISAHKEFFKSFKQNFKASLPMMIIIVIASVALGYSWYLQFAGDGEISEWSIAILLLPTIYYLMFEQLLLYILAKFENTTMRTIMLAVYMGIRQIDKAAKLSLFAIFAIAIPIVIYVVAPSVLTATIAITVFIVLITILQIISSRTVTKIFTYYLNEQEKQQQESLEATEAEKAEGQMNEDDDTSNKDQKDDRIE